MPHALLVEVDGRRQLGPLHKTERCALQSVSPFEAKVLGVVEVGEDGKHKHRMFPRPLMGVEVSSLAHTAPPNPRE